MGRVGAVVVATVALSLLLGAAGHGFFDRDFTFPGRYSGYDGGYNWPSGRGHSSFRNLRQQPCPEYRPMSVSEWSQSPAGGVQLSASLPGVVSSQRRVWLGEDGRTLQIKAVRPVPAQGVGCLPRGATVSQDRRHEVFDATVGVPHWADAARAILKPTYEGVHIIVPSVQHSGRASGVETPMGPSSSESYSTRESISHGTRSHNKPQKADADPVANATLTQHREKENIPPVERNAAETREPVVVRTPAAPIQTPSKPAAARAPTPEELSSTLGVEVVDEEYPWPEKDPDAAEGYWDNRGDFHEY